MTSSPILPGSTIGIIGGGQLGRMLSIAARRMGYRLWVLDPDPGCPAAPVADRLIAAGYDDPTALAELGAACDVVTYEFENVPAGPLAVLGDKARPAPEILHICQNREREKNFLKNSGIPCARFAVCDSAADLESALEELGRPGVLKTVAFGYDGKGQMKIHADSGTAGEIWLAWGGHRAVYEQWVPFVAELSVIVARNPSGDTAVFPPSENLHANHILDRSIVPARFHDAVQDEAQRLGVRVAEKLQLIGLIAVELFLTDSDSLIVNELAPRPHNSGHFTFDATVTSQFEQQVRAVCGLPLGSTRLLSPVVMVNLLGELWENGLPNWEALLREPTAKLHLYGKDKALRGRKMGHFCILDPDPDTAWEKAVALHKAL